MVNVSIYSIHGSYGIRIFIRHHIVINIEMKICIEAMVDPCRIEMDGQNLAAPKKNSLQL